MDDKQKESIASALKELAQRKGDISENLRLANDLKVLNLCVNIV